MPGLYSEVILDRFRHPRFRGELDAPDAAHEDVNPLCGDRIRFELRVDRGGGREIAAVRYRGDACAIALASADLLAETVEGRSLEEASGVDQERLLGLLCASIRPSRLRCVTLPLDVFRTALAGLAGSAAATGRGEATGGARGAPRSP